MESNIVKELEASYQVKDAPVRRRRITVKEYEALAESGFFGPTERVELIHGEMIEMTPIGVPHSKCVVKLNKIFCQVVADGRALLGMQNPIIAGLDSEPQPDVTLLHPDAYKSDSHPGPDEILLVVEVSDSTLRFDRNVKVPLFASAGIREAWIVDVNAQKVECYSEPLAGESRYGRMVILGAGATVRPIAFPDVEVEVSALFE